MQRPPSCAKLPKRDSGSVSLRRTVNAYELGLMTTLTGWNCCSTGKPVLLVLERNAKPPVDNRVLLDFVPRIVVAL